MRTLKHIFLLLSFITFSTHANVISYDPTAPKNKKREAHNYTAPIQLDLSMIRYNRKDYRDSQAFVGDQWYSVGEKIGQYTVTSITFDTVKVKDGTTTHKLRIMK